MEEKATPTARVFCFAMRCFFVVATTLCVGFLLLEVNRLSAEVRLLETRDGSLFELIELKGAPQRVYVPAPSRSRSQAQPGSRIWDPGIPLMPSGKEVRGPK